MNALMIGVGLLSALAPFDRRALVGVSVVDDATGEALPGLRVTGSFEMEPRSTWTNTGGPNLEEGITGIDGSCRLSADTDTGKVWCFVRPVPERYYPWNCVAAQLEQSDSLGRWQPDNLAVTIRLDRVEHPIPLWVKEVRPKWKFDLAESPEATCAYDLVKGDWLPPFGKGEVADLEIRRHPRKQLGEGKNGRGYSAEAFRDEVSVCFPGEDNGLKEMDVRPGSGIMVRTAPESGYRSERRCWRERGLDLQWRESDDRNRHFCFRIRTRRDESGRIVEAYYGKIYHDIRVWYGPNHALEGVGFTYYLNPTSLDRNLEWDRRNNLCKRGGVKTTLP